MTSSNYTSDHAFHKGLAPNALQLQGKRLHLDPLADSLATISQSEASISQISCGCLCGCRTDMLLLLSRRTLFVEVFVSLGGSSQELSQSSRNRQIFDVC